MNCIELFLQHANEDPHKPAIWMPDGSLTTYGELKQYAANMQGLCSKLHLQRGDGVLIFDWPSPRLYSAIIGLLGLGCHVVLIEPWMPLPLINRAVSLVQPKLFLTHFLGRVWGLRSHAIRSIPHWSGMRTVCKKTTRHPLVSEAVSPDAAGIVTFTTGTSGHPKGVVRTHEFLVEQHRALSHLLKLEDYPGTDLCVFANFALSNLASGRCSLLVPSSWDRAFFQRLQNLPRELQPSTLTSGPAFLKCVADMGSALPLRSVHIGGALTDCDLFEKGFSLWPEARWLHVYGSSEAEPVASAEARMAVSQSRQKGYFQTLYLGNPVPEIRSKVIDDTLWVSGPHVSTFYFGDEESNRLYKQRDDQGTVWHHMGDRVLISGDGWWYGGRGQQPAEEFALEQKLYTFLQTSACFVYGRKNGDLYLLGEKISERRKEILQKFPEIHDIIDIVIYRDKRHRARIDRQLSIRKGASWIVG